mgnify:CR=1 FL=1
MGRRGFLISRNLYAYSLALLTAPTCQKIQAAGLTTRGQKNRDFNDIMTGLWHSMRRGRGVIHRYGKNQKKERKNAGIF